MTKTNKEYVMTEYKRLKSTPGMWIIFFAFLALIVSISIFCTHTLLQRMSGDILPTQVFTVENDVVSLKLPNDWNMSSSSSTNSITWTSKDGYESLSISSTKEASVAEASIMYMLELRNMFPDVSSDTLEYAERTINGKKMFATHIMYKSQYYLCGVMESGNTIIKFVYSASSMVGEVSDIDTIIGSINYRVGGKVRE